MPSASTVGRSAHHRAPVGHLPTYVLGVPHQFRGAELLAQLADYGIEAIHVPALTGAALTPDDLARIYDSAAARYIDRELTPAEAACAFGHLTMMRMFLRTGSAWGLFLEDDAHLLGDPANLLELLGQLPMSPTVIHLQCAVSSPVKARCLADGVGVRVVDLSTPPYCTVGYVVNRSLAQRAVDAYQDHRIDSVADWPVRWRYSVQFAACLPSLVSHDVADSSIESDRVRAQAGCVRSRTERIVGVLTCLSPLRRAEARSHDYPASLVLRHNLIPIGYAIQKRWRRLVSHDVPRG